jgi:hypothetical protein
MVTPRTSQEATSQEIQVFEKFCADHDIVTEGPVGEKNVLAIGDYIIDAWKVQISEDTLKVALDKLRDRIVHYTPVHAKYKKIAAEDGARANQLNQWFHSSGNTSLVKDSEDGLENQTVLLAELRGREITPRTIQDAIGRASFKSGLHFVPQQRKTDPRQHEDDGKGFIGKDIDSRYRNSKLNHAYQEPGKQPTKNDAPVDAWEIMAKNLLNHGTHSQQAAFRETYDHAVAQGKSWREIYSDMSRLRNSYERVVPRGF